MLRFHAVSFMAAVGNFERMSAAFCALDADTMPQTVREGTQKYLETVDALIQSAEEVPIAAAVVEQIRRFRKRVATGMHSDNFEIVTALAAETQNTLLHELTTHLFLFVPAQRRWLFEQRRPVFGDDVHTCFPDAQRDFSAAGRCIALDEWTACVFHLMRALEHGLHDLAARVGVSPATPLELENWKNIIDQIEKEIRRLEQLPKSVKKSEDLQFYAESASQFRYFKDAWRNHVSHSRVTYDEREATSIWNHVREFMQHIAKPRP